MAFGLTRQAQRLALYLSAFIVTGLLVAKFTGFFDSSFHPIYSQITGTKFNDKKTGDEKPVIMDLEFRTCTHFLSSKGSCDPLASWIDNIPDPESTSSEIPMVWERIPKDLNLGKKWFFDTYLFQKTVSSLDAQASQVKVVNDIAIESAFDTSKLANNRKRIPLKIIKEYQDVINNIGKGLSDMVIPTVEQAEEMGWRRKQYGLWVKYGQLSISQSLTGINVLFGHDCVDPRPNWKLIDTPLSFHLKDKYSGGKASGKVGTHDNDGDVYVTIRRKLASNAQLPEVKLAPKDGKFKILQVADLHFSTGYGRCRDTHPPLAKDEECLADHRTMKFIDTVLQFEQPDLVVMTGDQVFGSDSPDSQTTIFKACAPFIKAKIPYAMVFVDHKMSQVSVIST
ncbi:unnamed protein product [Ambrosiozyma monospora]|uniref:Unnamed protein product n=1 Tax=Ambrosiozyma monospora TaxID=43982 RepID=A0ACB5TIU0_AMBMO|nr:unnamed protein product [Ambrosiozyma monospora]